MNETKCSHGNEPPCSLCRPPLASAIREWERLSRTEVSLREQLEGIESERVRQARAVGHAAEIFNYAIESPRNVVVDDVMYSVYRDPSHVNGVRIVKTVVEVLK